MQREADKLKNVNPNRKVVNLSIIVVIATLIGLTAVAVSGYLTLSLWGLVILASIILVIRALAPENVWFAAKSKVVDISFLAALIGILLISIPYVNLPSPV